MQSKVTGNKKGYKMRQYSKKFKEQALNQKGEKASISTVIRAMPKGDLLHKNRRSPDGLTKSDKKAQRNENILKRNFTATKPNEKWLTYITKITCSDGKLYIAPVFDFLEVKLTASQ